LKKLSLPNGYKCPTYENYADFNLCIEKAGIKNIKEAEIFLAHVIHETGGLRYLNERRWLNEEEKIEFKCDSIELLDSTQDVKTEEHKEHYNDRTKQSKAGKYYFGRGWLHLSWNYNYEACGEYFSRSSSLPTNYLLDHPELASSHHTWSWGTAAWFWKTQVKPKVTSMSVESTLRVINGREEKYEQAQNREKIYKKINLQQSSQKNLQEKVSFYIFIFMIFQMVLNVFGTQV